jgi:predicted nucleotidyltransferase
MNQNQKRHEVALDTAIKGIQESFISKYVKALYLYGSCARGDYKWDSDIDLLLVLDENERFNKAVKKEIIWLKGSLEDDDLDAPEVDLKVFFGEDWMKSQDCYIMNVIKDGVNVWEDVE